VQACIGADATKSQLSDLIHGPTTPALLFTATHGVGFPSGHPRQLREQGALLCQDWPGPAAQSQALLEEQYFAAADVGSQARLGGLIAFHFACFGAGTPRWDEFASGTEPSRSEVAPNAFVASLPKRLLAHEGGGALAVISHVDRAWGYSFLWPQAGRQTESYVSCLKRLLAGHPVGSAMEYFNLRYAELSSDLSRELDDVRFGKRPDHGVLAGLWTANNDARNVTVLGDPAVRLAVEPAFLGPVRAVQREVSPSPLIPPRTRPEIDEEVRPAPALTSALISPSPSPSPREPAEVDFGLLDGIRQARERLTSTLQGVAQSLGAALERAVDDVTVLEVATYTSDDISSTAYDHATGRFGEHARLRALTRVGIGGNTELLVAEQRDDVDERVWALHASMVQEARQTRVELLKATGATVAGLVDVLRGV
jgi:hypothetical protein